MDWRGPTGIVGLIILAGLALRFGGSSVGIAQAVIGQGGSASAGGTGLIGFVQALSLTGWQGNNPPGVKSAT
jgi:hypothetical protein